MERMIYCKGARKKYQWEKEELEFIDAFEGNRSADSDLNIYLKGFGIFNKITLDPFYEKN